VTGPSGPDSHPPIITLRPIGYVATDYTDPLDAPPQASEAYGESGHVVVHEPFVTGLTGLRRDQHVWLLTWLHAQPEDYTTDMLVVPRSMERTGGRTGVFATRTPHRHNRIGLSLVRITDIRDNMVYFRGVDLVSGTPVLDIKPWAGCDTPPRDAGPRPATFERSGDGR
jgi:tRNA-Thr(GGU) m(6)t(6)A37 methyltransferase TsaA